MSSNSVGPVGVQSSSSRVHVLDAVMSMPKNRPIQPTCDSTSSGVTDLVGTPR